MGEGEKSQLWMLSQLGKIKLVIASVTLHTFLLKTLILPWSDFFIFYFFYHKQSYQDSHGLVKNNSKIIQNTENTIKYYHDVIKNCKDSDETIK